MSHLLQKLNRSLLENSEKVAVEESGRQYTYKELKENIYSLAETINQRDVQIIAIIGEPSYLSIVCTLGAVFSRSTYVPIDPHWPISRISTILRKSKIKTIIGNSFVLTRNHIDVSQLDIDCFIDIQKGVDIQKVVGHGKRGGIEVIPFNLDISRENSYLLYQGGSETCYIMYTSGSTGEPKGVMVTSTSFECFLDWFATEFEITKRDRFAYISSLGFGASLRQIFSPLFSGATVVCLESLILKNPVSLLKSLQEKKITIFNSPPIVLKQIVRALDLLSPEEDRTLPHIRYALVGGDLFPSDILQEWYKCFPHDHSVVNLYGSTESVINASFYKTTPDMSFEGFLPIGRPRLHFSFMILDEKNRSISKTSQTGTLFIKSDVLSIGYHNDQKKTEETFVTIDGNSLYNTGDLAKKLFNGDYLVLGREDRQIQVYGQRVELGEIESTLGGHPQIEMAVAVDFKDEDRHKIYAYILPEERGVEALHCKDFLKDKLPSYMIPHDFEFVDSIVTTQSGKIDYEYFKDMARKKYFGCENQQKKEHLNKMAVIKSIWIKYLGEREIGIDESFFDVGGDSVIAVEIYQAICEEFNVRLDPFIFYVSPTIKKLAETVVNAKKHNNKMNLEKKSETAVLTKENFSAKIFFLKVVLKALKVFATIRAYFYLPSKREKRGPLSAQQKFFVNAKLFSGQQVNGCLTVPIKGHVDLEQFKKALSLTINSQDSLRTIFIGDKQIVLPECSPEIMFYDLSIYGNSNQEKAIQDINQKLLYKEFDFSNLPLFSTALIKKSETEFSFTFCASHIIADGWSVQIFLSFLNECYGFLQKGVPLPQIPSYIDYTLNYKKFCRECYYDNGQFWKKKLSHINDYNSSPRMAESEKNPPEENLSLNREQIKKVEYLSAKYDTPAFYIFMALWSRAFARLIESSKITFFITYHNRAFKFNGLQNMIGSVARIAPIFLDFSDENSFQNILEDVKKSYLETLGKSDFNIFKYYLEFASDRLNRNRFATGFNYIDCRPLSRNLKNFPFDVDTNNCKIQISRNQSSSHPAYFFFSVHHYLDHINLQAYGNCPKKYKRFVLNSIRDQIIELYDSNLTDSESYIFCDETFKNRERDESPSLQL